MASRSAAMELELESMEQRLQLLKALMADEKAKRESKRLPGGTNWRSSRQDGTGSGSRYVDNVLKERPPRVAAQPSAQSSVRLSAASGLDSGAPAPGLKPSSGGRVGRLRAAAAGSVAGAAVANPLAGELTSAPPPQRPGRRPGVQPAAMGARPVSAAAAPSEPTATAMDAAGGGQGGGAAELFAWHPDSALPTGDYEVAAASGNTTPLATATRDSPARRSDVVPALCALSPGASVPPSPVCAAGPSRAAITAALAPKPLRARRGASPCRGGRLGACVHSRASQPWPRPGQCAQ